MTLIVHQSIHIHMIRIDGMSNASVFQVGCAGIIRPQARLMNTGGFTGPAPPIDGTGGQMPPFVPLVSPSS